MSEQKKGNPFLPENFLKGGGLWDGKVITVTKAYTEIHKLVRGDGSLVVNEKGEQSSFPCLTIVGVSEDSEAERREQYKVGSLLPSADGKGLIDPKTGGPGFWSEKSQIANFAAALVASGFDVSKLYDERTGMIDVSVLVGAKFLMKGTAKLDAKGNPKKNAKGYEEHAFFPVEFKGYVSGGSSATTHATGNGAAAAELAEATIVSILAEAEGKVSRSELLKRVGAALAGNPDANKVIALIAKDDFHKDKPWTRDGTGYVLA